MAYRLVGWMIYVMVYLMIRWIVVQTVRHLKIKKQNCVL